MIAAATDTTAGRVPEVVNRLGRGTSETAAADLAVALTTDAATTAEEISIASETPSADFLIASLADSTSVEAAVEATRETRRAYFCISLVADATQRRVPDVAPGVFKKAPEATRTDFAIAPMANRTSTKEAIEEARRAMCTKLFEPSFADDTARVFEMVVDQARETGASNFAPPFTARRTSWNQVVADTREAQRTKLCATPFADGATWAIHKIPSCQPDGLEGFEDPVCNDT